MIEDRDCTPVIPPKSNRTGDIPFSERKYNKYKKRKLVEHCINKLKQCRHIATRYDRKASAYMAFAKIAAVRLWLRIFESAAQSGSGSIGSSGYISAHCLVIVATGPRRLKLKPFGLRPARPCRMSSSDAIDGSMWRFQA
ncbi:MAG: transposase, partial [Rhizobiales bacterium]|nr:transposase [Hyphomicrobiales bacterium]